MRIPLPELPVESIETDVSRTGAPGAGAAPGAAAGAGAPGDGRGSGVGIRLELEHGLCLVALSETNGLRLRAKAGGRRFDAVLAGIDGLRHADEHAGDGVAVDFDRQILDRLGALHLDLERSDLRIDRGHLLVRRGLCVPESLWRVRRQLLFGDPEVRLARFHELPELGMCARQVEQVRRRVHERFGLRKEVDRVFVSTIVEGCRPLGGQRTRACALFVGLPRCDPAQYA